MEDFEGLEMDPDRRQVESWRERASAQGLRLTDQFIEAFDGSTHSDHLHIDQRTLLNIIFVEEASRRLCSALKRNSNITSVVISLPNSRYRLLATLESGLLSVGLRRLGKALAELSTLRLLLVDDDHGFFVEFLPVLLKYTKQINHLKLTIWSDLIVNVDEGERMNATLSVDGRSLRRIFEERDNSRLERLDVVSSSVAIINATFLALTRLQSIRNLSVSAIRHCELEREAIRAVVHLPNLHTLYLAGFFITQGLGLELFLELLSTKTSLKELSLITGALTGRSCSRFIASIRYLEELSLFSSQMIDDAIFEGLPQGLRSASTLKRFTILGDVPSASMPSLIEGIRIAPNLQYLKLPACRWSAELCHGLRTALEENSSISELDLDFSNSTVEQAWMIVAPALRTNTMLWTLNLKGVTDNCLQVTAESLVGNLWLRRLHVENGRASLLAERDRQEQLGVTHQGVIAFLEALPTDTVLNSLGVFSTLSEPNEDTDEALLHFVKNNYEFVSLSIPFFSIDTKRIIECILCLNGSGRRYLVEDSHQSDETSRDPKVVQDYRQAVKGVNVLAQVCNDLDCSYFHLRENPSLCDTFTSFLRSVNTELITAGMQRMEELNELGKLIHANDPSVKTLNIDDEQFLPLLFVRDAPERLCSALVRNRRISEVSFMIGPITETVLDAHFGKVVQTMMKIIRTLAGRKRGLGSMSVSASQERLLRIASFAVSSLGPTKLQLLKLRALEEDLSDGIESQAESTTAHEISQRLKQYRSLRKIKIGPVFTPSLVALFSASSSMRKLREVVLYGSEEYVQYLHVNLTSGLRLVPNLESFKLVSFGLKDDAQVESFCRLILSLHELLLDGLIIHSNATQAILIAKAIAVAKKLEDVALDRCNVRHPTFFRALAKAAQRSKSLRRFYFQPLEGSEDITKSMLGVLRPCRCLEEVRLVGMVWTEPLLEALRVALEENRKIRELLLDLTESESPKPWCRVVEFLSQNRTLKCLFVDGLTDSCLLKTAEVLEKNRSLNYFNVCTGSSSITHDGVIRFIDGLKRNQTLVALTTDLPEIDSIEVATSLVQVSRENYSLQILDLHVTDSALACDLDCIHKLNRSGRFLATKAADANFIRLHERSSSVRLLDSIVALCYDAGLKKLFDEPKSKTIYEDSRRLASVLMLLSFHRDDTNMQYFLLREYPWIFNLKSEVIRTSDKKNHRQAMWFLLVTLCLVTTGLYQWTFVGDRSGWAASLLLLYLGALLVCFR